MAGVTGNMTIVVHRAMNLPESNLTSKNDPYIRIRLDTQDSRHSQRGKYQNNSSTNPVFEQKFAFFLQGNEREVCLEIWDDDYLKDDKLAYAIISIQELLQHSDKRPFMVNLMSKGDRGRAGMVELSVIADSISNSRQQQNWQGSQQQYGQNNTSGSSWGSGYGSSGYDTQSKGFPEYGQQQQQQQQQESTLHKVARKLGLASDTNAASNVNDQQSSWSSSTSQPSSGSSNVSNMLGSIFGYPMTQQYNNAGVTGNMTIVVLRAMNLPESNFLGKNDPYVRIRLDTQDSRNAQRGKHQSNGATNPVFDQKFAFFLNGNERAVCLEIWDDDYIKDDKLAYALIPVEELMQHTDQRPFTINLMSKGDRGRAGMVELVVIGDNLNYSRQSGMGIGAGQQGWQGQQGQQGWQGSSHHQSSWWPGRDRDREHDRDYNQQQQPQQEGTMQKVARKLGLGQSDYGNVYGYPVAQQANTTGAVGTMIVNVHRAFNLPESNFLGKNDPYVRIRLDTQDSRHSQRGKHHGNSARNPIFDQRFQFNLQGNEQVICLEFWDDDYIKDDKLAYALIPIEDLLQHADGRPFVVDLVAKGDRGHAGTAEMSVIAPNVSYGQQHQGQSSGWGMSSRHHGHDNTGYGSNYGSQYGSGYGSQYGSGYGSNYGSQYGSQYGSGYGPSYGSQYGSGIGAGTHYGTGYGSNYGSGYSGPNYGSSNYGTYNTSSVGSNDRESLLDKGMRKLGITGTDVTSGTGVSSNSGYTTGAPSQTESRIADRQGLGSSNSNLSSGQSAMTGMAAGLPGMPSYGGSGIGSATSSSGGTGANVGNAGNYSQGSSMPTSGSSYNNDNESLTEKASRKLGLGEHAYDKSVMDQGVTSQRPMSQQGTMVDKPK